ncbi:MAG: hypothetical protein RR515_02770 [Clostridium sp.]
MTYIVGVYWTLGSALALSLSPLGIIPIYGMAYLAVENNVMLISGTMLIIIILNIILYFRLNNRRYKK